MKNFFYKIVPGFSELEVFVTAYAILLLFFAYSKQVLCFGRELFEIVIGLDGIERYINGYVIYFIAFALFIVLSIHHTFSTRKKNMFEKGVLLTFMLLFHVSVVVVLATSHVNTVFEKILFVWNALYLFVLLSYVYYMSKIVGKKRELFNHMIKDENASTTEILVTTSTCTIVFNIMIFVYKVDWFLVLAFLVLSSVPLAQIVGRFRYLLPVKTDFKWPRIWVFFLVVAPFLVTYLFGKEIIPFESCIIF